MKTTATILSTKKLKPEVRSFAEEAGFSVIDSDFIKVVLKTDNIDSTPIFKKKTPLIFTSGHGVEAFIKLSSENKCYDHAYKAYCISGETKKKVELTSGLIFAGSANNAKLLAEKIISEKISSDFNYICGQSRRDELPELLKAAGISVAEFPVYETLLTGSKINQPYHAVLFFSPSGVQSYFQTNLLPAGIPCFCIGETTATAARDNAAKLIRISEQPDQKKLIEKTIAWFNKTGRRKRI